MLRALKSVRSHAVKDERSSHPKAISPTPPVQPAPPIQLQFDVVSQLLPTLMAIQKAFSNLPTIQANPAMALVPTPAPPAIEPVLDELIQGVSPGKDNVASCQFH